MSLHILASHLAHAGRGKDSMLMHVTPSEVMGLQSLAKAKGGSLTVNPHTGLPEAGFLDDTLSSIGSAFSGGIGSGLLGAGLELAFPEVSAMNIALGVGGLSALSSGNIGQGLAAGLGAYGGAGLTSGLYGAGENAMAQTAQGAEANAGIDGGSSATSDAIGRKAAQQAATNATAGMTPMSEGLSAAAGHPIDFLKDNKGAAMAALAAMSMSGQKNPAEAPVGSPYTPTGGYRYGRYNPNGTFSNTGSNSIAEGYHPPSFASGGQVAPPGSDSDAVYKYLMGLGPNPYLQAYQPAATVTPPADKPKDPAATPATPAVVTPAATDNAGKGGNSGDSLSGNMGINDSGLAAGMTSGATMGLNGLSNDRATYAGVDPLGAMMGLTGAFGTATGLGTPAGNIDGTPDDGTPDGTTDGAPAGADTGAPAGSTDGAAGPSGAASAGGDTGGDGSGGDGGDGGHGEARGGYNINGKYYPPQYAHGGFLQRGGAFGPNGQFAFHGAQVNTPVMGATAHMAGGGIASLGSYSDGGRLLKGPGDGVSDSIPATIGQHAQPARLADGEFVIPARIVSELGNGSSDAGAKQLYQMMARIQANRAKTVGKNKTAVDSKSAKYLPA